MSTSALAARPDRLPPPLEMEAMKVLWQFGEATVSQVQLEMRATRPLAYTTVMTLLDRLARKGAVTRRKQGRSYLYRPVLSREAAVDRALDRLVDDFFDSSRDQLLSYLRAAPELPAPEARPAEPLDSALL